MTRTYKQGDQVICNGYRGAIIRYYSTRMVEVRLASGETCVDVSDIAPLKALSTGRLVLAKDTKYGLYALTYANRTQAEKTANRLGGDVIRIGRPFYVSPKE